MHKSVLGLAGAVVASLVLAATPAHAASKTIVVPYDFNPTASDTRLAGHYEVQGTALHIWTDDNSGQAKVAEYVDTSVPLADAGEPSLSYTPTAGTIPPGFQLMVDFDDDGSVDGILVGETVYGNDWWASNGSKQFVKDGAPSHSGGFGSANHGTLDQWRAAFPNAVVRLFGFSMGSGVYGDGLLSSMTFAGDTYTFASPNRDQCKDRTKAQHKAFDDQQKADKDAFKDDQKADEDAFKATNPSKDAKKAFDEQQKADKKDFEDDQKADKKAEDDRHKTAYKACDDLPKD